MFDTYCLVMVLKWSIEHADEAMGQIYPTGNNQLALTLST